MVNKVKKLNRRIVKVEYNNGSVVRGILYDPKIIIKGKVKEGVYLIRYLPDEKSAELTEMVSYGKDKGSEIVNIAQSRMSSKELSKYLRAFEKELDKKQKELRGIMKDKGVQKGDLEERLNKHININPSSWEAGDPRFLIKEVKDKSIVLRIELERDDGDIGGDIGVVMKREHDGLMTVREITPEFDKFIKREFPFMAEERIKTRLESENKKVVRIVKGADPRKNTESVYLFWVVELEVGEEVEDRELEYLERETNDLIKGRRTSRRNMGRIFF